MNIFKKLFGIKSDNSSESEIFYKTNKMYGIEIDHGYLNKFWYSIIEGKFGYFSMYIDNSGVRALWMRDVEYEDPDDGTHGIITSETQRILRAAFDGESYVFRPLTNLSSVFQSGKLRAIKIKESLGGGYVIVIPGKEFEIIGWWRMTPYMESQAEKEMLEAKERLDRNGLFSEFVKSRHGYGTGSSIPNIDPNRNKENLIIKDAKRVLLILNNGAVSKTDTSNSSTSECSYPPFMLSVYILYAVPLMLLLTLAWYLIDAPLLGTFLFFCAQLATLCVFYYRWYKAKRLFNINEDEVYDVYYLSKLGLVEGIGTGQSITKIFGQLNNLSTKKLKVKMMVGTYFKSTGEHQNMVSTKEYSFILNPLNGQHVEVKATCINANRPIPGETDSFEGLGVVSKKVRLFIQHSHDEDPMTIQAGVWACTDNFSGSQIKKHLISTNQQGHQSSAVSDYHIKRARSILAELKISTNL